MPNNSVKSTVFPTVIPEEDKLFTVNGFSPDNSLPITIDSLNFCQMKFILHRNRIFHTLNISYIEHGQINVVALSGNLHIQTLEITIYLKLIYSHFISWSKATRNPISIFVTRGEHHARAAQRQLSLSIVKSPPRTTLSVPVFGPVGFQANPPEPP